MEYNKKDDTTLEVVKSVETVEEKKEYKLDFLKQQEVDILKQKNDFVDARNKELEEVRALIVKCEELGIQSQVEFDLASEEAKEEV